MEVSWNRGTPKSSILIGLILHYKPSIWGSPIYGNPICKHRFGRFSVINGHSRNLNWRYLPYIRPMFQGIFPQNMAQNMVRLRTSICWILKISHWCNEPLSRVPSCHHWIIDGSNFGPFTAMGPPFERSREPLPDFLWLNSMVYGRYNELVNGGYFMVYKPTNITEGAPSCSLRWHILYGHVWVRHLMLREPPRLVIFSAFNEIWFFGWWDDMGLFENRVITVS